MKLNKIDSFTVDHNKLIPGIYLSRIDGDITTYDLRFKKPNSGDYLDNATMHTTEHLMATYMRSCPIKDDVIYFGPMGCRTGFYLLVRNADHDVVINQVIEAILFCADFNGVIPGVSKIECGNYLEHNLNGAKKECLEYYKNIKNYSIEMLKY